MKLGISALTAALLAGALAASAFAQKAPPDPNSINLNSSRSNIYREAAPQPLPAPTAAPANPAPAGIAVSDPGAEGTKAPGNKK